MGEPEPEPEAEAEAEAEGEPVSSSSSRAIVVYSEAMLFTNPRLLPLRRFAMPPSLLPHRHDGIESADRAAAREIVIEQRHQQPEYACDWDAGGSLTGAAVWDAALVLAHYLHTLRLDDSSAQQAEQAEGLAPCSTAGGGGWEGRRVLELGCGAGLLAIAAAQLGAKVVATDMDARVCSLCAHNAAKNGVDTSSLATAILPWGSTAAVTELDAAMPCGVGSGVGWDLVLAADCVYPGRRKAGDGAKADRPLLDTLLAACRLRQRATASAKRSSTLAPTLVVCGYKTRSVEQLAFFRLAKKQGFHIQWVAQSNLHPDFQIDGLPDNPADCCSDGSGGQNLQLGGVHVCVMSLVPQRES